MYDLKYKEMDTFIFRSSLIVAHSYKLCSKIQRDVYLYFYKSKKDGKDQERIQSSITSEPGYHKGKKQKYNKHHHHQQEPRDQPFPADDHKAAMDRRKTMGNTRHKTQQMHKRSTALEQSVNILLKGFLICKQHLQMYALKFKEMIMFTFRSFLIFTQQLKCML